MDDGLPIFNNVNDKKNYTYAMSAFAIGAIFLLFSFFALPVIILSPHKFTLFFCLSMICFLVGMGFMNGPKTYLKKLSNTRNRLPSLILIFSLVSSLYCALIYKSYILSILFCFIQLNAVCYFFFNSMPFGVGTIKIMAQALKDFVAGLFSR